MIYLSTINRFPRATVNHSITLVYIVFQKVILIKNNILPQTLYLIHYLAAFFTRLRLMRWQKYTESENKIIVLPLQ